MDGYSGKEILTLFYPGRLLEEMCILTEIENSPMPQDEYGMKQTSIIVMATQAITEYFIQMTV